MRFQKTFVLLMVAAVPAAAPAVFKTSAPHCFTAGPVTYLISPNAAAPDLRIRIDNTAAYPDMRVRPVDDAATADFVLVNNADSTQRGQCDSTARRMTISIVGTDGPADLTLSMSDSRAKSDYRIYVKSDYFSEREAAALLAAMTTDRRTAAADR